MKSFVSAIVRALGRSTASRRPLARLLSLAPAALLASGLLMVSAEPFAAPVAAAMPTGQVVVAWGSNHDGETSVPAGLWGVTAISGGFDHSLALKSNGTVVAWGDDYYGQTDVPAGLSDVIAIAAGDCFSLALKSNGTVVGWGIDNDHQTDVPADLSGVTAIAAGGGHGLALRSDRTVVAWGYDADGQADVPAALSGVTAIAAGQFFSLALKANGTVVAWGDNSDGNLDIPTGLSGVTAIAAGPFHSLALKSKGTIAAWGINATDVPAGLSGVTAIAAGGDSLALKSNGTVVGWSNATVPSGLSGVTAIAAGAGHNLALMTSATATLSVSGITTPRTAGSTGSIQVTARDADGNTDPTYRGSVHFSSSDAKAVMPANYTFTAADAGAHVFSGAVVLKTAGSQSVRVTDTVATSITGAQSGIAVTPGQVASFIVYTVNPYVAGVAHDVTVTATDAYANTTSGYRGTIHLTSSDTKAALPASYTFTAADAGVHEFSLGLTLKTAGIQWVRSTDTATAAITGVQSHIAVAPAAPPTGVVVAWGDDYAGASEPPASLLGVTAIAAGDHFSLALKSNGTVVGWGLDTHGQTDVPAGLSDVTAIAAGGYHSLALKSDGTVVAWGDDYYGQTDVPAGLSDVIAIAAGGFHSLALKSNGTVVVWGYDYYGQTDVPAGLSGVIAISAGGYYSLALKSDGTVVGWGDDTYGQTEVPAGLSGVIAISAGGYHSLALKSDGTVVGWGFSWAGETVAPAGLSGVTAIAAGYEFSFALKSDGTVVGWGTDGNHQTDVPAGLTGVTAIAAGVGHILALEGPALVVSGIASLESAGVAQSVTVTATDASGNTDPGYTGTVHFTSSDTKATLPTDYTFTSGDAGSHTFSVTLKTAGTKSVTAADTGTGIKGSQTVTVTPGAAKTLSVSGILSVFPAGSTHSVTVKALDAYGNVATGYTGTIHFTSTDSQASLPANYTFTSGDKGVHAFASTLKPGLTLKTAGTKSVTATDVSHSSIKGSQTVTVTPGAAKTLKVVVSINPWPAGSSHSVKVTALDAYGNVATGYTGTVHFTSSDTKGSVPADYTFTATDKGVHTFPTTVSPKLTLKTTGSQWVKATDKSHSSITGVQSGIVVTPAVAKTLSVSTSNPWVAGATHSVTVEALDAYGNVATGYRGTVHFTSSDPAAVLPANYTFVAADHGVHTFSLGVTLETAGSQNVTAIDTVTGSIKGWQTGIVVT